MGISGIIPFLSSKAPHVVRPLPSFDVIGGKRVFIDCSTILRRSLHASMRTILDRFKYQFKAVRDSSVYIDTSAMKDEIMNCSVHPLSVLNKSLQSVDHKGGIESTFVLGPFEDTVGKNKLPNDPSYINILDIKNRDLVKNLKDYCCGNESIKFYPSLSHKDINHISQKLIDQFAKKCVEFCTDEDDYVISDDTNVLAYGAPNVIRDFLGSKQPNTINHKEMLEALEFTRDQFVDFCILLGYKHSVRIPDIGPYRAYSIIKRFYSLERFFKSILYQELFKTKKGAEVLSKYDMTLDEFTDKYFNLEQRDDLKLGIVEAR
ncbi:DNA repair protein [Theileria orientalis]|uniref:DNA repair protein n=1 Tax=Theileria orientalis TaxID=68886 RepID=A0A976MC26_THEOR|nr:DNA repair protein [Theileria orientalis]